MEKILTTDPSADIILMPGKTYFVDFDSGGQVGSFIGDFGVQDFVNRFQSGMAERGHPVKNVGVGFPEYDVIRIYFEPTNPPPLLIIIAVALAILMVGFAVGGGVYVFFKQLGEVIVEPFRLVEKTIETATENPIPVIAIMVAIAIAFFGFMRE